MDNNTVRGSINLTAANSQANAISFLVDQMIKDGVNTADVVKVMAVHSSGGKTGFVDVLLLVAQTDAEGSALPAPTIYRLPYMRVQGGIAALIIDPVPGDIGLAVFTKRDSTLVKNGATAPVIPGSFRTFSMADGFYLGGFLNQEPQIYLELTQDKEATLHAPVKVTVNTNTALINASAKATIKTAHASIDAAQTDINGNVFIAGGLVVAGTTKGKAGSAFKTQGGISNTGGNISSNAVVLDTHTHNYSSGGGTTSSPNK